MNVTLHIQRFNPETDKEPYFKDYSVEAEPTDRVLDALMDIARNQDGTLVFRRSCAHGVCGSDAMLINGRERLACKTLIRDVVEGPDFVKKENAPAEEVARGNGQGTINIAPLNYLPVERDLMVNQKTFFDKYREVKPFFIAKHKTDAAEEILQSQEDREKFDDGTKCIKCAACYSACPVLKKNPKFLGPMAIVQASRFVFDSRDQGLEPRLDSLDTADGVWPCENHFECTRVCPRDIKVTKLINLTKREIKKYRAARGEKSAEPEKA